MCRYNVKDGIPNRWYKVFRFKGNIHKFNHRDVTNKWNTVKGLLIESAL